MKILSETFYEELLVFSNNPIMVLAIHFLLKKKKTVSLFFIFLILIFTTLTSIELVSLY